MAIQNAINLTTTGVVSADGAGVFTGRTITGTADFIDVTNGDGTGGNPTSAIASNFESTGMHGWNGSIIESIDVEVTSDGVTITASVDKSGGGDLTVVFSDGYHDWDTTPADTITLTAGSDTSPTLNYVYFLQSTKVLTISTSSFPTTEHAPLATVLCQSAASLQTDGAYKVHVWRDHLTGTNNQGHMEDVNSWIRSQHATWTDGVAQTYTITTNGGSADNVILTTASGNVRQLHPYPFPAFSGTPDIYVINDSVTPYNKVTDLNALLTDSTGASMSGRFFSLVIWGVVSENTADSKLFCNLPSGSYNNKTGVETDLDNFATYTIPTDFVGTGFLISEWKLRHQVAASGTWTSIDEIDLRGLLPAITAGGGTSPSSEFVDNAFRIVDDGDNTKEIAFEASSITTGTTRTFTAPDASGILALETGMTANGIVYANTTTEVTSSGAPTDGQILVGVTSAAPNLLKPSMLQGLNCWMWNLGFTHAAGTLTLHGYEGTALSSTNPGYILMPSNATPGTYVLLPVTANDTLTVTDLTDNLLGSTVAVAWGNPMPLAIGFMADSSDANLEPIIYRTIPLRSTPSSDGDIGDPSSATADEQYSVFAWNDITQTNYTSKAIGGIGTIRATKDSSDVWTLTALDIQDGVGHWQENRQFLFPVGHNGAAAGKHFLDNGGTAPVWSDTTSYRYWISRTGEFRFQCSFGGVTTGGVGAVAALVSQPYGESASTEYVSASGRYFDASGSTFQVAYHNQVGANPSAMDIVLDNIGNTALQLANVDSSDQLVLWGIGNMGDQ